MPDISQFLTARIALASQDAKNLAPYLPLQSEDLAFETVHDTPEYTDVKIHFTTQDRRTFSREVRAWKPVTSGDANNAQGAWTVYSANISESLFTANFSVAVPVNGSFNGYTTYGHSDFPVGNILTAQLPALDPGKLVTTITLSALTSAEIAAQVAEGFTEPLFGLSGGVLTGTGRYHLPGGGASLPSGSHIALLRRGVNDFEIWQRSNTSNWKYVKSASRQVSAADLKVLFMVYALKTGVALPAPSLFQEFGNRPAGQFAPTPANRESKLRVIPWTTNDDSGWYLERVLPLTDFWLRVERDVSAPLVETAHLRGAIEPASSQISRSSFTFPDEADESDYEEMGTTTEVAYIKVRSGAYESQLSVADAARYVYFQAQDVNGVIYNRDTHYSHSSRIVPSVPTPSVNPFVLRQGGNTGGFNLEPGQSKTYQIDAGASNFPMKTITAQITSSTSNATAVLGSLTLAQYLAGGHYYGTVDHPALTVTAANDATPGDIVTVQVTVHGYSFSTDFTIA